MTIDRGPHDNTELHSEWKEFCALSITGALERSEEELLRKHLAVCRDCLLVYRQFETLAVNGMPFLASLAESSIAPGDASAHWNPSSVRQRLFNRIEEVPAPPLTLVSKRVEKPLDELWRWGVAAVLILGVGFGAYQLGRRSVVLPPVASPTTDTTQLQQTTQQKLALDRRLASETDRATEMEKQLAKSQERVAVLEVSLHDLESRSKRDQDTLFADAAQFSASQVERENLAASLHEEQRTAATTERQLAELRRQRDQDSLHYASLEVEVSDLTGRLHDAEARDRNDNQYLASDRDIRELMGARQLYIADVVDVDQNGEKRKPFGRIFYTKGKSLIFYAFDLDRQPKVKNVSNTTFQAWAREGSDNAKPVSLGVFYVDSEINRRWVLKAEDPKTLAQINSVFVTVEPKGGSQKPSGRQLLSAYLRSASPNHP